MRLPILTAGLCLALAASPAWPQDDAPLTVLKKGEPQAGVRITFFGDGPPVQLAPTLPDGRTPVPALLNFGKPGTTAVVKTCGKDESVWVIAPGATLAPADDGCRQEAQGKGDDSNTDCRCRAAAFLWNPYRVEMPSGGGIFSSPITWALPTVAGVALVATRGDGDGGSPTPGVPPSPGPGSPPPAQRPVEMMVREMQLTILYQGFATGALDFTGMLNWTRVTNNCRDFFFPRFQAELVIRGSGAIQAAAAQARAEGSFVTGGVQTAGVLEITTVGTTTQRTARQLLTPSGRGCTETIEAMFTAP
jgi:hypothetical protein